MVGKSVDGQKHYQKPDHGKKENTHYSCVDDVKHPNIFVIFDPNQIYPEYLIQYRWSPKGILSKINICIYIFSTVA